MDVDKILKGLPEEPSYDFMTWCGIEFNADLGGHLLTFSRESWSPDMDLDWMLYNPGGRRQWAARCRCSACGSVWHSGWIDKEGVRFIADYDGFILPGIPDDDSMDAAPIEVGTEVACPFCGEAVTLAHKASLRRGQTWQLSVMEVANVDVYTVMIWWIVRRFHWPDDTADTDAWPAFAVAIDEDGGLHHFTHAAFSEGGHAVEAFNGWRPLSSNRDPSFYRYYSYQAVNHTQIGAFNRTVVPNQLGMTGEKTGLAAYLEAGGEYPWLYLRFWRNYPTIENLVKAGWVATIDACIFEDVSIGERLLHACVTFPDHLECMAEWFHAKPSDMMCMTKEEIREGGHWRWGYSDIELWWRCVWNGWAARGDAAEFQRLRQIYKGGLFSFFDHVEEGDGEDWRLDQFDRYLEKQEARHGLKRQDGLTMLMDYRTMLADEVEDPQPVELWPPDLRAAHDRLAEAIALKRQVITEKRFGGVIEKWADLEWSDGEICAVLPRSGADLQREGRVLHHCVGGYGESHLGGKLIIFIRHARRPERPWFTLNIDTTKGTWREIQLHGYGNERGAHGALLKIPKRVREWIDRWEADVLTPTFAAVKIAEAKKTKKKTEKRQNSVA